MKREWRHESSLTNSYGSHRAHLSHGARMDVWRTLSGFEDDGWYWAVEIGDCVAAGSVLDARKDGEHGPNRSLAKAKQKCERAMRKALAQITADFEALISAPTPTDATLSASDGARNTEGE